jgi:hypothetical protein
MESISPYNLTRYELEMIESAKQLKLGLPPPPWSKHSIFEAAGIFAAGWNTNDDILMFSLDGYSLRTFALGDKKGRDTRIT